MAWGITKLMIRVLKPIARLFAAFSIRQQRESTLSDVSHWGATVSANGRLIFDGVDVAGLIDDYGSPLMAVSRNRLRADAKAFGDAAANNIPDPFIAFSYKTNCVARILRELHDVGFGAEVISPYELWLAESLGVPGDRIIVNGVNKGRNFLDDAVRLGVFSVNIDVPEELDLLLEAAQQAKRRARVSLRLRLDESSHFGLSIRNGEALRVAKAISQNESRLEFVGLHFHTLADNRDAGLHAGLMVRALRFAETIKREFGLQTRTLNIGGGYAVPTVKVMSRREYALQRLLRVPSRPPDPARQVNWSEYMRVLGTALREFCAVRGLPLPRLAFEPGRAITSCAQLLLTSIHAIKPRMEGYDVAMTDAGKILITYPCDYEYHQIFVANRMLAAPDTTYDLMGRLCTDADWLARTRLLPRLATGDVLAVMDAGAYFTSYSSNFSFPRPPIVLLDEGIATNIREAQSFEHLAAPDRLPERPKAYGRSGQQKTGGTYCS